MIAWHKNDLENRMYVNLGGGKKASMPRYFKLKIYSDDQRKIIAASSVEKKCKSECALVETFGIQKVYESRKVCLEKSLQNINQKTNDSL